MLIEIFSDIVCPWCFIGKRRLDAVLGSSVGQGVELRWRAYQLYPGMPAEGMDRQDFERLRYGSGGRAGASGMKQALLEQARDVGLELDLKAARRMPSTLAGHRLLWFAYREAGWQVQHKLADVLFRRHFCDGGDVGETAELLGAATEVGLDPAAVRSLLAGAEGAEEVVDDLTRAREAGVAGVPSYLFGGLFSLPGAQTEDVISHFVTRARQKLGQD